MNVAALRATPLTAAVQYGADATAGPALLICMAGMVILVSAVWLLAAFPRRWHSSAEEANRAGIWVDKVVGAVRPMSVRPAAPMRPRPAISAAPASTDLPIQYGRRRSTIAAAMPSSSAATAEVRAMDAATTAGARDPGIPMCTAV